MVVLSAQKEDIQSKMELKLHALAGSGAVGKILASFQHLGNRLQDVTLEEIALADEKASKLVSGLSALEQKLERLSAIQNRLAEVETAVKQILPEDHRERLEEILSKPQPLPPRLVAKKLIVFPTLIRTLKDSIIASSAVNPPAPANPPSDSIDAAVPAWQTRQKISEPEALPNSQFMATPSFQSPDSAATESEDDGSASPEKEIGDLESFTPPEPQPAGGVCQEQAAEVLETADTEPLPHVDAANEAVHQKNKQPDDSSTKPPLQEPQASTALVPSGFEFDEDLLTAVIKDYGEFASVLNLPATIHPQPDSGQQDTKSGDRPPEAQTTRTATNQKSLARRTDGDLDRQLKKLIKEYGEYDIYSHQSSKKLKARVLTAFLLLGLMLSAFYYFGSGATPVAQSPATHSQASSPEKSKIAVNETGGENNTAEKAGTKLGLPKIAEASDSR